MEETNGNKLLHRQDLIGKSPIENSLPADRWGKEEETCILTLIMTGNVGALRGADVGEGGNRAWMVSFRGDPRPCTYFLLKALLKPKPLNSQLAFLEQRDG
jgi:hypothetical protein